MTTITSSKADMLHDIARSYVERGLGGKNFDAIPYDDNVVLRAPICPGGSAVPLVGKENLRSVWWAPLPSLVGGVKVIDSFINEDKNAVAVEFHCQIINPACTLRVIDKFTVNEEGKITAQENFLDPRDITNPGWQR
jgi:hypothetical protein